MQTRRQLLRTALLVGLGTLVTACDAPASPGSISASQPTSAAPPQTSGPPGSGPATPGARATIVFGAAAEARSLNPLLANDGASMSVWELVFEPLLKPDPQTGAPVPALAEGWEQSADGKTLVLHLRSNVSWSDGQPLTAEDAKFTFDTVMDPKAPTVYRSRLDPVQTVEALDPTTLRIILAQPFCPFLADGLQIPIVPKHLLAGAGDLNTHPFNTNPVGSGPFMFKEWRQNDHLTLVANPNYWGGQPKIDQWIRKIVKDDTVIVQQLKTGEVDYASVQPEALDDLRGQPNLNASSFPSPISGLIAYNLDRPLLQDKRVRQALTYALDRAGIVSTVLFGEGDTLDSPILPQSWAYNSQLPRLGYDAEKARELLREAGWSPGPDGVLQKDGARFEFTLLTNTGNKVREAVMTIAQDQWAKVGVKVRPEFAEFGAVTDKYQKAHDFDAVVTGAVASTDPDLTAAWSSRGFPKGGNYVHYANPQVDALLDQARTVADCDQSARKALYDRAQALIVDDQPVTFLFVFHTSLAVNKRIQHMTPSAWAGASPYVAWNAANWTTSD